MLANSDVGFPLNAALELLMTDFSVELRASVWSTALRLASGHNDAALYGGESADSDHTCWMDSSSPNTESWRRDEQRQPVIYY